MVVRQWIDSAAEKRVAAIAASIPARSRWANFARVAGVPSLYLPTRTSPAQPVK